MDTSTSFLGFRLPHPFIAGAGHIDRTVTELKRFLKIPIAVKISPFFAAFGHVARQLDAAGTDGIVCWRT